MILFAQDTFTENPDRLYLTFGTKVENRTNNGYGIEPSVRLAWTPPNRETFWAAVSRAERSPARKDTNLVLALAVFPDPAGSSSPVEVVINGNPKAESEHVIAYEAGYRAQPMGRLSIDVSTFFNRYDHRITLEPGSELFEPSPAPARFLTPITFQNLMYGTTEGAEVAANLKITNRWTLNSSYSFLEMHLQTKPASQDATSVADY